MVPGERKSGLAMFGLRERVILHAATRLRRVIAAHTSKDSVASDSTVRVNLQRFPLGANIE